MPPPVFCAPLFLENILYTYTKLCSLFDPPLNQILMSDANKRESYKLEAMAQDRGYPPLSRTVEVQVDVVDRANNPPVWDHVVYGPIYIKENMPVGAKVVSVKARSVHTYKTNHLF
jgi:hypothetical protein